VHIIMILNNVISQKLCNTGSCYIHATYMNHLYNCSSLSVKQYTHYAIFTL